MTLMSLDVSNVSSCKYYIWLDSEFHEKQILFYNFFCQIIPSGLKVDYKILRLVPSFNGFHSRIYWVFNQLIKLTGSRWRIYWLIILTESRSTSIRDCSIISWYGDIKDEETIVNYIEPIVIIVFICKIIPIKYTLIALSLCAGDEWGMAKYLFITRGGVSRVGQNHITR